MLLKIGTFHLNPDHITSVEPCTTVVFRHEAGFAGEEWIEQLALHISGRAEPIILDGNDAAVFRRWLGSQAIDLHAPEWADKEYQAYRAGGGALRYADWQRKRREHAALVDKPDSWYDDPRNAARIAALEAELGY